MVKVLAVGVPSPSFYQGLNIVSTASTAQFPLWAHPCFSRNKKYSNVERDNGTAWLYNLLLPDRDMKSRQPHGSRYSTLNF